MPNEIPTPRRFLPAPLARTGAPHRAFRGETVEQRYVSEMESRLAVVEGTVHAFERRLNGDSGARAVARQRATLPRGEIPEMIEGERGAPLRVLYENLLNPHSSPQARRDIAWRCHDERACRRHINQQPFIEPVGPQCYELTSARLAEDLLKPEGIVERELGRYVGHALHDPLPMRPRLFEKPADRERVETLERDFKQLSERARELALARLVDRIRAGGPVFPYLFLSQRLAGEFDRTQKRYSFADLIRERCSPQIAPKILAMLGRPGGPDSRFDCTDEELHTPTSLLGMFGLSLLQGASPREFQWESAVLNAERNPDYFKALRTRALLEGTGRLWQPPPQSDGNGHHPDLFSQVS